MKAIWKDQVVAQSEHTVVVESNHYFPMDSIQKKYFTKSGHKSVCPWKGEASYFSLNVNGEINPDAAWYYPETKTAAKHVEGMVAFWRGVQIVE